MPKPNDAVRKPALEYKKIDLAKLVAASNIAPLLEEEQLKIIGSDAVEGYTSDRASREGWEQRNVDSIKLALQVTESKTFPWPNCANVKFPMVTVAALQFLARVSLMTKGRSLVQCDVLGPDPQGIQFARSKRISAHMSYQLTEEDQEWVNDDEKAKFAASIMGCSFKKSYFDPVAGINLSEYVPASRLVVDYHTKNFNKCGRVTHVLSMNSNEILERERRGIFCKMDSQAESTPLENSLTELENEVQGIESSEESATGAFEILEQHCWLDLDGDDYKEPYIVFVRSDTAQVLRIVARFFDEGDVHRVHDSAVARLYEKAQSTDLQTAKEAYTKEADKLRNSPANLIMRIDAQQFFTKYTFIPSIDGGFYDLGFGALLGPVNRAVDTLINQQLDSGTMQVTAGGFLGRGVKIKSGKSSFDPFEWKPVDSQGDDLRKNIVPLPTNAPSQVLFSMLGLLIQYGEKISGSTDIMTGENPGQNTPAETSRNTIEQGMALFSGIYFRMYRAFQQELRLRYRLNQLYLETTPKWFMMTTGGSSSVVQGDYATGLMQVSPAADPSTVSSSQRQQKAMMVHGLALQSPNFNTYLATKNMLEAFEVQDIEHLLPDPTGPLAIPAPGDPKIEIEKEKLALEKEKFQFTTQQAVFEMKQAIAMNEATIQHLEASATKLLADAQGVGIDQQIAAINAQTGAAKTHQEGMIRALEHMQAMGELQVKQKQLAQGSGTGASSGGVNKPVEDTPAKQVAATALQSLVPDAQAQPPGAMNNGSDPASGAGGMDPTSSDPGIPSETGPEQAGNA